MTMKPFWISWYAVRHVSFTLHWPWWFSGARLFSDFSEQKTVCAAVQAESEDAAKEIIFAAHDTRPKSIEWRFCEECPVNWSPFSDRFPRADWMQWMEGQNGSQG